MNDSAMRVARIVTVWTVLLVWPVYLFCITNGGALLGLLGGIPYESGAAALAILAAGMLFASMTGPVDTILLMAGAARSASSRPPWPLQWISCCSSRRSHAWASTGLLWPGASRSASDRDCHCCSPGARQALHVQCIPGMGGRGNAAVLPADSPSTGRYGLEGGHDFAGLGLSSAAYFVLLWTFRRQLGMSTLAALR